MSASTKVNKKYGPPIDVPCITLDGDWSSQQRQGLGKLSQSDHGTAVSPFLLTALLSKGECDRLIKLVETPSKSYLQKVDWEYSPSYRDCSRAVLKCPEFTSALYKRILPLLSESECEKVRPYGFDGGEEWRPQKLNEVIRISRYDRGDHFATHKDGAFVQNDNVRSVYTVLVYLNEPPSFKGGNTVIYLPSGSECEELGIGDNGGSKAPPKEIVRVVPKTGSAVVMLHDTLHAGAVVSYGSKYICRLDIMFHRLGGGMTSTELSMLPARVEAERLYASSIAKQKQGDVEGSTNDYLRAQELQAQLPSCSSTLIPSFDDHHATSKLSQLSDELVVMCFRFLDPTKSLHVVSLVSKRLRSLCNNSLLWREYFLQRWPTLVSAESTVYSTEDKRGTTAIPLAIHEPRAHRRSRPYERVFNKVYVALLSSKPRLYQNGYEKMNTMYSNRYGTSSSSLARPPRGYMFSSLTLADFDQRERKKQRNWICVDAAVNEGAIQFAETDHCELGNILPSRIPLQLESEPMFAANDYNDKSYCWIRIDSCIVKIPGGGGTYVAICTENPLATGTRRFGSGFIGILCDISRVLVARQTERALRYLDKDSLESASVRCEAKTKQWKTAYSRRHLAERYFDVVTVDVGSHLSKFTSSTSGLNEVLSDRSAWSFRWCQGPYSAYLDSTVDYFLEAARKHRPDYLLREYFSPYLVDPDDEEKHQLLRRLVVEGIAEELVDLAKDDSHLALLLPRPIVEAKQNCGSIRSVVRRAAGHLWSAGHGLQNSLVGEQRQGRDHVWPVRSVFDDLSGRTPDTDVMGIVIAHIVEECFVRRPRHSVSYHQTCAEHPINIVEPVLRFSDGQRMELIQTLSTWNVPFVGFVNGAVAALMCGKEPKQNGIVAMLGGTNSAVAAVKDGEFVLGTPLGCCNKDDDEFDEFLAAKEVSAVVGELLNRLDFSTATGSRDESCLSLLLTGGRATDKVVSLVKKEFVAQNVRVVVASQEKERHLDAVRGAHVLASLSDGRKHFRGIMNLMWAVNVQARNTA